MYAESLAHSESSINFISYFKSATYYPFVYLITFMKPKPPEDHDHVFPLGSSAFLGNGTLGNDKSFSRVQLFATL